VLRCIGTVAIDCRSLCGCHGRRASGLWAGRTFCLLKLLERGGKLLLMLSCFGVALRLQLLLRLKAINLLRIGRCRTHRHRAGWSALLVPTQQAGEIRNADKPDNDNQGDYDRHPLSQRGL